MSLCKGKVCWAYPYATLQAQHAGAYPGFHSITQLGVGTPPGQDASLSQVTFPVNTGTHLGLGGVRKVGKMEFPMLQSGQSQPRLKPTTFPL